MKQMLVKCKVNLLFYEKIKLNYFLFAWCTYTHLFTSALYRQQIYLQKKEVHPITNLLYSSTSANVA